MNNIEKYTLLVVDDEVILRSILIKKIESFGAKVFGAENGQAALEILQKEKIDAVLTDLDMPIMGGLELLTLMREKGFLTPVVILTGHGDQSSILAALRLGAIDFLDKPFNSTILMEVITKALNLGDAIKTMDSAAQQDGKADISTGDFRRWKTAVLSSAKKDDGNGNKEDGDKK